MNFMQRVRRDAQRIMKKDGQNVVLITPDGLKYPLNSIVSVIHNLIDPDTGQPVSGFLATASINRLDLNALDIALPEGEASEFERPWLVRETNIDGIEVTYKITRSAPDEANGNILCDLGAYGY